MIDPPPQIPGLSQAWKNWLNHLWVKVINTDGGQTIKGDLSIGGGLYLTDIPTSDPLEAGRLWNDSGTIKVSSG